MEACCYLGQREPWSHQGPSSLSALLEASCQQRQPPLCANTEVCCFQRTTCHPTSGVTTCLKASRSTVNKSQGNMIPQEPRYPTTSIPEYTNPPKPQENDLNFNHIKILDGKYKSGVCVHTCALTSTTVGRHSCLWRTEAIFGCLFSITLHLMMFCFCF